MKIGIITHWWSSENYGQLLQCYALQAYLHRLGHDAVIIRYSVPHKEALMARLAKVARHPLQWLIFRWNQYVYNRKILPARAAARMFPAFREKYLKKTSGIYHSVSDLNSLEIDLDALICGSDQVWNFVNLNSSGKPWFLNFGDDSLRRIAYAASFGRGKIPSDFLSFIRPLLAKFDAIGVRERSGVDICRIAGRNDAEHVVDPTLLLSAQEYLDTFDKEELGYLPPNKMIFAYFLQSRDKHPWNQMEVFAKTQDSELIATEVYYAKLPFCALVNPTIPGWIQTIKKSEAIFTNSFHGTVFSIILRRPFISFLRSGNTAEMNDRIYSLLDTLRLTGRIYNPNDPLGKQVAAPIDWDQVYEKLEILKDESKAFLRRSGF